jgi:hypothetical protein
MDGYHGDRPQTANLVLLPSACEQHQPWFSLTKKVDGCRPLAKFIIKLLGNFPPFFFGARVTIFNIFRQSFNTTNISLNSETSQLPVHLKIARDNGLMENAYPPTPIRAAAGPDFIVGGPAGRARTVKSWRRPNSGTVAGRDWAA